MTLPRVEIDRWDVLESSRAWPRMAQACYCRSLRQMTFHVLKIPAPSDRMKIRVPIGARLARRTCALQIACTRCRPSAASMRVTIVSEA